MRKFILILLLSLLPWQALATTTLYVDTDASSPTHPTYNHLADAIAYLQGYNGGVLDDDFVVECSGATADTVAVTISGITTTVTNDLTVQGEGIGVDGLWNDNKYRMSMSHASAVIISGVGHITIENLQAEVTLNYGSSTGAAIIFVDYPANAVAVVEGNYFREITDYSSAPAISHREFSGSPVATSYIRNNIISGYSAGIGIEIDDYDAISYLHNNTIINCGTGIVVNWDTGNRDIIDNIVVDSVTTDYDIAETSGAISHNISSDTTAPGSNSLTNQVVTDLMTDPANGDFTLKSGSNAIGAGTDLSAYFTNDITGATRSVPWDIGAFAYATAATTPFRFYNGSSWLDATPYRYNGSAWEPVAGKRYNGLAWE